MGKQRAVAYIRVSTESDMQLHSYEFQEQYWNRVFENDPNTELVGIYADRGISGHTIRKRPNFLVMMQDARDHKFDKIYTKSVSRFSRNTKELLETVRELRDIGIEVIFEKENVHTFQPGNELYLTIAATIAENDLDVDSQRMRWSVRHRYENGWLSVGHGLYGFRLTPDNNLELVPEEAEVIRYIYDAYVNGGLGCGRIADELNKRGVEKSNGYPWNAKHIAGLIRNEKYKGDVIMGKSGKYFGTYHSNRDGKYGPKYFMENTHEAIVSRELWDAAQRKMDDRTKNYRKDKPVYPFTRMIECGCCGTNYVHKINCSKTTWETPIWLCRKQHKEGVSACRSSQIKDSVLKEKFVSAYNEFVEKRPQGDSIIAMTEVLDGLRCEERDLALLNIQHLLPAETYETERKRIQAQIAEITKKITDLRLKRVPESEHVRIAEFDENKIKRFLKKVIVSDYTVTFVFYNGAKIRRRYDNGQPGRAKKEEI